MIVVLDGFGRPVRRPRDWRPVKHSELPVWAPGELCGLPAPAHDPARLYAAVICWSVAERRWQFARLVAVWREALYLELARWAELEFGRAPWRGVRIVEKHATRVELQAFVDGLSAPGSDRLFDDGFVRRTFRELLRRRDVIRSTGCFVRSKLWVHDYDLVSCGDRRIAAHQVAFEYCYGPLRPGLVVMHSCDVRACFRPGHLGAGTHAENMADMAAKGRAFRRGVTSEPMWLRDDERLFGVGAFGSRAVSREVVSEDRR